MERTGRIRPLSEGKDASKPFGIWYCGGVQKTGQLEILRNRRIPKLVFHARIKTIKDCAYSDRSILMPQK